jgi:hypothetical protein
VVLFHWLTAEIPSMWKPFCLFDLVFLILFVWAYLSLRESPHRKESADHGIQPTT